MILVTGANGHFGKAAVEFLLKKGIAAGKIAALVRDEAKGAELKSKGVNVRIGDYNNYASLVQAFKGVDKLLLVSGTDLVNRSKQQENAVKAATEAGVKHIVYTSFERKNETDTSPIAVLAAAHLQTEAAIKNSGISYTILRNNYYMDYISMILGEKVLETGVFYPAGEGKIAFALRNEMAEAAANILASDGHQNKEYRISHSEQVSFSDIAKTLSDLSGKTITYISPDVTTYVDTLIKAGTPKEYAGIFGGFGEAMKQGELAPSKSDLENLLGRKPTSVREYLKKTYFGAL
jgi:NAD(P)H dehydrogenase (quinone)